MKNELAAVHRQQADLQQTIASEEESGLKLEESDLREYKRIKQDVAVKSFDVQKEMTLLEDQLKETQVGIHL